MHDEIIVGFKSSIHCIIQLYKSAVMALACFFVVVVNFFFGLFVFFFFKVKTVKKEGTRSLLNFSEVERNSKSKK